MSTAVSHAIEGHVSRGFEAVRDAFEENTNDIWIANTHSGGLPVAVFVTTGLSLVAGQLQAYRVLMVWVYDRTVACSSRCSCTRV